jgi:hypothetical protein
MPVVALPGAVLRGSIFGSGVIVLTRHPLREKLLVLKRRFLKTRATT